MNSLSNLLTRFGRRSRTSRSIIFGLAISFLLLLFLISVQDKKQTAPPPKPTEATVKPIIEDSPISPTPSPFLPIPIPLSTPPSSKPQIPVVRQSFAQSFINSRGDYCCCADLDYLLPYLTRFYEHPPKNSVEPAPLFIDIGANIGGTTSHILSHFGHMEALRFHTSKTTHLTTREVCPETTHQEPHILTIEPIPETFGILQTRATEQGWTTLGHVDLIQVALSDARGNMTMETRYGGDELSRLVADTQRPLGDGAHAITIPVWTLDALLTQRQVDTARVFLLKIDVEGFDPLVLRGAHHLLSDTKRRPRFIAFEYNGLWNEAGHGITLKQTITRMDQEYGYVCFQIGKHNLLPLYEPWWVSEYEAWKWSNVFCAQRGDRAWRKVLAFYNRLESATEAFLSLESEGVR